ncbi:MAG: luxQ 3 [Gammaproteobacteria bacterium]|nr:luxQ 3 [Gammaproteobacteria bacterium]
MRATETQFHWLANSLSQLIWGVDAAGRLTYGNSAWYAFTAIGEGARFLESYLPALHPADRSLWRHTWEHAVAAGEPYALERRVRFTPESNYVRQLEWGNPILNGSGRTGEWLIIATDADENERVIVQLRRCIERKDKFLALAAHEMRGPLAPISSALKLLRHHMDEPAIVNKSCATMARQVAQLVRLVDDLFDLARAQNAQIPLSRAAIDLEATLAAAIEAAQPMIASRGHQLTVVTPPDTTVVDGDAGRLTQVFANLLINAAKFTDDSGRICVLVERESAWVLVKVRDTGIGIAREMLPRVFDAYVQAERGAGAAKGGLGLGLTLARHLIELHGGTLNAFSEGPGRGSEFVVRLPAACGPERIEGCVAKTRNSFAALM